MPLASQYLLLVCVMCKPRLKYSLGSLARLSTLSWSYLLTTPIYIFVLSSEYLVEYTLHQNLMIEIYSLNFDLHITVPSPNLAFLCRNLDYKSYSINQLQQCLSNIFGIIFYNGDEHFLGKVPPW